MILTTNRKLPLLFVFAVLGLAGFFTSCWFYVKSVIRRGIARRGFIRSSSSIPIISCHCGLFHAPPLRGHLFVGESTCAPAPAPARSCVVSIEFLLFVCIAVSRGRGL